MRELDELKKIINDRKFFGDNTFYQYGRTYHHTNENLREYMPNLHNKKVLTVSSSGDHLLNALASGAIHIDTFDLNSFSPLIQSLKLYAIRYLDANDSYEFLNTFDRNIYYKFNSFLPSNEKKFFDFFFKYPDFDELAFKFFYHQNIDNIQNNKYFDISILKYIRANIKKLINNHLNINIYYLPCYIKDKYDAIFLSNISQYINNVDRFLTLIYHLRNFLNDDGCIYYAYLYDREIHDVLSAIKSINNSFLNNFDIKKHNEIIKNTESIVVNSAENPGRSKDSVLVIRK